MSCSDAAETTSCAAAAVPDTLDGGPGGDILDGGEGTDTVSFATSTQGLRIDLETNQHTNDALGDTFLSIERFEATPYNDTLIGTPNSDSFFGLAGNDRLEGRDGDDGLEGGPGADTLIGGPGYDYTTYFFSPAAVEVNLLNLISHGGDAEGDTLDGIESLVGSPFDDTLTGNDGDNYIDGIEGRDTINGGAGNDELHGGLDKMDFERRALTTRLTAARATTAFSAMETATSWMAARGMTSSTCAPSPRVYSPGRPARTTPFTAGRAMTSSTAPSHNDIIDAGEGDDFVDGSGGRDRACPTCRPVNFPIPNGRHKERCLRLYGMGGDQLEGGPGNDTVSFRECLRAVTPDLAGRVRDLWRERGSEHGGRRQCRVGVHRERIRKHRRHGLPGYPHGHRRPEHLLAAAGRRCIRPSHRRTGLHLRPRGRGHAGH